MLVRMNRALVRRAEAGDLEAVIQLRRVRADAAKSVRLAMIAARSHYTLDTIATECGVTKQTVAKTVERAAL